MSKKIEEPDESKGLVSSLMIPFTAPWRGLTLTVLLIAGIAVGVTAMWPQIQEHVSKNDDLWLTVESIDVTPQPSWIRVDVRTEVLRDASLDGPISILDPALAQRVAEAFVLHPWVADVTRVQKHHPARVSVELEYRKPACMVLVSGRLFPAGPGGEQITDGLYPVDAQGVFLPPDDFSPIEAARYPRLVGANSIPVGPPGTRWGDSTVHEGARIAAVLVRDWLRYDLERIEPTVSSRRNRGYLKFDLVTKDGTRVQWGFAPQPGPAGETVTREKLSQLDRYAEEHGSLNVPEPPNVINLQSWDAKLEEEPFTADRRRQID